MNQSNPSGRANGTPYGAPFNFVPLSGFVWFPEGSLLASHVRPFREGWSGELEIELTNETPILVGGGGPAHRTRLAGGATEVRFATTRDAEGVERYVIPGSSLRGMLRNVIEIAFYGRMALADDVRFGVRDLSGGVRNYGERLVDRRTDRGNALFHPKVRAGWLRPSGDKGWEIVPCSYGRVWGEPLFKFLENKISKFSETTLPDPVATQRATKIMETWMDERNPEDYHLVVSQFDGLTKCWIDPRLQYLTEDITRPSRPREFLIYANVNALDIECSKHTVPAHVVITGPAASKRREFVFFHDAEPPPAIGVSDAVMRGFLDVHEREGLGRGEQGARDASTGGTPWSRWRGRLKQGLCGPEAARNNPEAEPGIPVFWLEGPPDQPGGRGPVQAFGLASMFRLPADHSTDALMNLVNPHHRAADPEAGHDMAELLFGCLRPDQGGRERSLRGRVAVGRALGPRVNREAELVQTRLLGSPKASFFPAYLRQPTEPGSDLVPNVRDKDGRARRDYRTYLLPVSSDDVPAPEPRGWKRYPPHDRLRRSREAPGAEPAGNETRLHLLPERQTFRFTLRLHNMRPMELGALLWALRFGDEALSGPAPEHRHGLGMGKPHGFGQVWLRVVSGRFRANDPRQGECDMAEGEAVPEPWLRWMAAAEAAADAALSSAPGQSGPPGPEMGEGAISARWRDSELPVCLLALAKPQPVSGYMVLDPARKIDEFRAAKKEGWALREPELPAAVWRDKDRFPRAKLRGAVAPAAAPFPAKPPD